MIDGTQTPPSAPFVERPAGGENAVLVHVELPVSAAREELPEFESLAGSAGVTPKAVVTGSRKAPDPKYFIGTGKADEVYERVLATGAEVVLFNHELSPSQERNLEQRFGCRVLDRTGLILDIFAQRARSHEGKLQVELAQLQHLSTRLVRGWTHLERQKGGIGLRGPGETQLEVDRRLIGHRIKLLKRRLQKVTRQREQGRRARHKAEVPTLSLVGYTNAGKSTLFNALTDAEVQAADQLFATLDPTLRHIALPGNHEAVVADTVGFIRHLPHDLVAAFRSTLQETRDAQLLVHVVDAHDEERQAQIEQVNEVLAEIGAQEVPQLEVFNKIDLCNQSPRLERDEHGQVRRVWVSAHTGAGLDLLIEALGERLRSRRVHAWVRLPPSAGRLRSRLFDVDAVVGEELTDQGEWLLEVDLPERQWWQLHKRDGLRAELVDAVH